DFAMTPYIDSGPQTALTLPDGRDCVLHPGQTVVLPHDNAAVVTLCALGRLSAAPAAPGKTAAKPTATTTATKE
uniref:hypothetical protein n=1 Tax=Rhodoferax sp. TaxID=50421 RepID=UPI0026192658